MTNRALLIGINYPGTSHALRGCVNDVLNMEHVLGEVYGFTEIHKLIDHQATTYNILNRLEQIVKVSQPGDKIFFHFSGHGSQIRDLNKDEADNKDEILCPIDLNWRDKVIKDDHLCSIFSKARSGVEVVLILDCCHSGDGMDFTDAYRPKIVNDPLERFFKGESRYLPPPEEIRPISEDNLCRHRSIAARYVKNTGMLISGCRSYQTSADAYINGFFTGACTYYLLKTLKDHKWSISYKDLTYYLNFYMIQHKFTQRPELSGDRAEFNNLFLGSGPVTSHKDMFSPSLVRNGVFKRAIMSGCQEIKKFFNKNKFYE